MSLLRSIIADARPASPKLRAKKNAGSEAQMPTDAQGGFRTDKLAKRASSHPENSKVKQLTRDNTPLETNNRGEEISKNAHANKERLSSEFANALSKKHTLENLTSQSYMQTSTRTKGSNTQFVPTKNLQSDSISQDHMDNLKSNEIKPKVTFQINPTRQENGDVQNTKQRINSTVEASNSLLRKNVREKNSDSVITKTITVRQLEKTAIEKNGGLTKIHHSDYNMRGEGINSQQTLSTNKSSSLLINRGINQSNTPKKTDESKAAGTAEQSKKDNKISDDSPYSEKEKSTNINQRNEKDENDPTNNEQLSWKNAESDKLTSTEVLTSTETEPLRSTPAIVVNYDRTSINDLLQSQLQSFSSQTLAYQASQPQKKSAISQEQPKVHIGQIDIIIEAKPKPIAVKPDNSMPQINIASSLLLRRL